MRLTRALSVALFVVAGCKRPSLYGYYCEGGVRQGPAGPASEGGECMQLSEGDAGAGSARWVADYQRKLTLRESAKDKYTLHDETGVAVGTLERNGKWIRVLFTIVPPGSATRPNQTYALRSDSAGPLI